jgi:hypothetical protein
MTLPRRIQTDNPSFARDTYSRALLNTDTSALERHRRKVTKTRTTTDELVTLRATQHRLEDQVRELTEKLDRLLDLVKR